MSMGKIFKISHSYFPGDLLGRDEFVVVKKTDLVKLLQELEDLKEFFLERHGRSARSGQASLNVRS